MGYNASNVNNSQVLNKDFALFNGDLVFSNGDISIGQSDVQHVMDTINAFPGWWKENPNDGVGINQFLNSIGAEQEISKNMALNLQSDGYQCSMPLISIDVNGLLSIDPNAIKRNQQFVNT